MRRLLVIPLLLLPLAACGSDDEGLAASSEPTTSVTVTATVGGAASSHTLECGPTGGDHPDAQAACEALAKAAQEGVLAPPPADQVCTQVFGGPEVGRIVGTVDGTAVDRALSRSNGCNMSDWEALGAVLPAIS